ncbi:hypothetical protein DITRI_Ditri06bG0003400 [Diplodiscus trichospermus]
MDSNLQTLPPDSSDAKATFHKPSNDTSNRHYRRRSPVSRLSSPKGCSPQRNRSVIPMVSGNDLAKSADTQPGRDGRELDRDSSRNQDCRNGDYYRYSDRQSCTSSHGYTRHDDYVRNDKRADEYSKYDRSSSRSSRETRVSTHSDYPRQKSDVGRSKDHSRNSDKYSHDRFNGSGHWSREKEKELPYLERHKYKDKDSYSARVGSGRRRGSSISEEMDRDRRKRDKDGRDEGDYHRSTGDRKGNYGASCEESRGHLDDSSSGRERDSDKYRRKEGYKSGQKDIDVPKPAKERMKYDEEETNVEKDRYGRGLQFGEKSIFDSKNQDSPSKKLKFSSPGKDIDYDKDADENQSSLKQAETGGRVTMGQVHGNEVDTPNDLNAAKMAAMKAAELVNRNLTGACHSVMTTEQKKKLLWGSKKITPAEESGHRWNTALFGDHERQEKFNKLMGVKGNAAVEPKPDNQDGIGLLQAEQQRELQLDLEKQYTAGLRRRDGRTVGLGL